LPGLISLQQDHGYGRNRLSTAYRVEALARLRLDADLAGFQSSDDGDGLPDVVDVRAQFRALRLHSRVDVVHAPARLAGEAERGAEGGSAFGVPAPRGR